MLGYIFEECVEGDQGEPGGMGLGFSPWRLAKVCRFWYQTAKGTPSLWRKILITDWSFCYWSIKRNILVPGLSVQNSSPELVRSHSALQVCLDRTDIANALQRSGSASLEVTIAFSGRSDASEDEPETAFFQGVYDMVFNDSVLPRISKLVFDSDSDNTEPWESELWGGQEIGGVSVLSSSLPNLVSLQIYSYKPLFVKKINGITIVQTILQSATKLRDFGLENSRIPRCLRHDVWRSSNYNNTVSTLRELRIRHTDILDRMLGGSIGIEALIIHGAAKFEEDEDEERVWDTETTQWPTSRTPEITFERLTKLHLISDDYSLLDRLKFPLLEELRLTQSSSRPRTRDQVDGITQPPSRPDFTLELPSLSTLQVTSSNITPLNRFNMPQLKNLRITSTRIAQGKADADFVEFVSGSIPSSGVAGGPSFLEGVRNLYINSVMSEKGSMSTLNAFPSLRTFRLVPGKKMGKSLIQALCVSKNKRDPTGTLCPLLKKIEIDCYSFREWDKKEKKNKRVGTVIPDGLQDLLSKLVQSREKLEQPLEHCSLTEMGGTKSEYV